MEKIQSLLDHIRALESELQTINEEIEKEKGSFCNTEEKLRTEILNSFDELIAFYEPDHKIKWLNNSAKRQLGILDNSYVGKQCYKVWYNSPNPCNGCPVVVESYESSERITTRGDKRSWLVRHTPLVDSTGKISGYIEFSSDITVKLELESELKKSRERLQKAEMVASLAHFEHDIEKNIKLWSQGAYPILGLSQTDEYLINKDFLSNVHPDDFERANSELGKAYSQEIGFDMVYRIIDANGIEKILHGLGKIQSTRNGFKKFFGTMQDITHILKLKKKLAEEEDKYKKLADNSPMGICIGNDQNLIYLNETLLKTLGYKNMAELIQNDFASLIHPEDLHVVTRILKNYQSDTILFPEKKIIRILRNDKSIRFLEVFVTDCTIDNCLYLQAITQDITAEMEIEQIRKKLAADALYINQKNKITLEIRNELDKIVIAQKKISRNTFQKIYDIIGSYERLDDDWKLLKTHFEQIHPNFFTRLKQEYPSLSVNDIKHCACIKLNFDTKETARFFNVKPDSIQMSRVRLKKKLFLPETTDLRGFVLNF
jgi:PAS domain S-box-containing protein